jgi:hypothetical protein
MSDIVERLRQQATVEAKKFGDARDIQIEWRAAEEIERLRAEVVRQRAHKEALYVCVAMIERAAAGAIYSQEMIHAMALGALKILEVKP